MEFSPQKIKCKFFNGKLCVDLKNLVHDVENNSDAYLVRFVVCNNELGMLIQCKDETTWHMAMSKQYVGKPLVKSLDIRQKSKTIKQIDGIFAVCLCRKEP